MRRVVRLFLKMSFVARGESGERGADREGGFDVKCSSIREVG